MSFLSRQAFSLTCVLSLTLSALVGCQTVSHQQSSVVSITPLNVNQKVEAAQLINAQLLKDYQAFASANVMVATKKKGILIFNHNREIISALNGYFTTLDHRIDNHNMVVTSVDGNAQQAMVAILDVNFNTWTPPLYIPKPNFKIEDTCLYQDSTGHHFVFLVGEEGLGEQWLVSEQGALLPKALLVRQLSLPPASKYCQVRDEDNLLYVNEENVGLWAYDAHAESELSRQAVAMRKPFGDIEKSIAGMAVVDDEVLVLDLKSEYLHRYQDHDFNGHHVKAMPAINLTALNQPDKISARENGDTHDVLIQDKDGLHLIALPKVASITPSPVSKEALKMAHVKPLIQTDAIPSLGDAADDPAIWVHPSDATKSLVLGTDKQGGLAVYNLAGREQQYLPVGRLNNIDIRTGFDFNGQLIDIAVASNRDHHSLHVFSIDRETGLVSALSELPTTINDMYGMCLFKDKQNRFFAIVNDKDGRFEQYDLTVFDRHIKAHLVRRFKVATQPEACVADDSSEQLFIGEEGKAVWVLNANADAPITMTKVAGIDANLHADIEGIAYYRGANKQYLVISSQGNDSYVVLDAAAPYQYRGSFKIDINAPLAIDGTSEIDGLEVTSLDLSGNNTGPWRLGMLVVQDGRKRMPEGRQNFKYVPWTAIKDALKLE